MIQSIQLCICMLLAFSCLSSNAADAAGCRLDISNSEFDYGTLSPSTLKHPTAARFIELPARTFTLTAHCTQPTAIRIAFNGAANSNRSHQIGSSGEFTLDITRAILDGDPVGMFTAQGEHTRLLTGEGLIPQQGGSPALGKHLELQISLAPRLHTQAIRHSDELRIHGEGHFLLDTP